MFPPLELRDLLSHCDSGMKLGCCCSLPFGVGNGDPEVLMFKL